VLLPAGSQVSGSNPYPPPTRGNSSIFDSNEEKLRVLSLDSCTDREKPHQDTKKLKMIYALYIVHCCTVGNNILFGWKNWARTVFSARVRTTLLTSLCSGKMDKKSHLTPINQ
jgi:hypothetical protein